MYIATCNTSDQCAHRHTIYSKSTQRYWREQAAFWGLQSPLTIILTWLHRLLGCPNCPSLTSVKTSRLAWFEKKYNRHVRPNKNASFYISLHLSTISNNCLCTLLVCLNVSVCIIYAFSFVNMLLISCRCTNWFIQCSLIIKEKYHHIS